MARPLSLLQTRYRGALMGVLVGDCYGAPFERSGVQPSRLAEQIEQLSKSNQALKFTDDTALTKATCRSLIKNKCLNAKHMAQEYSETYFKDPNRGYGAAVRQVFAELRDTKYREPFRSAANQFQGQGSFGNGSAMRCNGLALFAYRNKYNERQTFELVDNCSRITHSHIYGIHGAVLLVAAIKYVLALEEDSFNEIDFIDYLIKLMHDLETVNDQVFTNKLMQIKLVVEQLATSGNDITQNDIVALLGNDVSAQNSVPLAIYSFIRGNSKFTDSYRLENEFVRTLHWAISCGGDTDTIASMACGLCGAYLGLNKIPESIYRSCETWEDMVNLADQLTN